MGATAFATVEDYTARYGAPSDPSRCSVLLGDASDRILSAYEAFYQTEYAEGEHAAFDRSACAVCCTIVERALATPEGFAGATQVTQTGGPYSASVTFQNPTGEVRVFKGDYDALGLCGMRLGSISPMTAADRG